VSKNASEKILGIKESESPTGIIAGKTRWLAIATGCFTAVTGSVSVTWLIAIIPILLILGAIAQPRFPRVGLGLMSVSALFLSLWVLPIGVGILFESVRTLRTYHDFNMVAVTALWVVSFLLLTWCDAALAIEVLKLRRFRAGTS